MSSVIGKHGIDTNTPGNILLGAGTYMKGLKWEGNKWTGTILGATNGGGKIGIKGELQDIEIDGALVKIKGFTVKQGGTANAEVNFAVITNEILKMGTLFKEGTSDATGYTLLEDKPHIENGDYIDNFGFVGKTADGSKDIIVIFESALCTSGIELEPKKKEQAVVKLTLEAYAENSGDLDTLPVKIYYPETPIV
jgi:hypothetical protein